jgi:hypothetical protein
VAQVTSRTGEQRREQVLGLVAGQPDQRGRRRVVGLFGNGGHHQEGVGEQGQGDPAVPGAPAAHLVFVQARLPAGSVYPVACGDRLISGCPHDTGSSTVAALVCRPAASPSW